MRSGRHARVAAPNLNRVKETGVERSSNPPPDEEKVPKTRSLRGRSGCLNCRRRRKKCDEGKPVCAKCQRLDEECEWDSGLSFRLSGIDASHPSMVAANDVSAPVSSLQMVDVTFDAHTHQRKEFINGEELMITDDTPGDEENEPCISKDSESRFALAQDDRERLLDQDKVPMQENMQFGTERRMLSPTATVQSFRSSFSQLECFENVQPNLWQPQSLGTGDSELVRKPSKETQTLTDPMTSAVTPNPTNLPSIHEDETMIDMSLPELQPLDYLTDRGSFPQSFEDPLWPPLSSEGLDTIGHVMAESPDMYAMYYPNNTYRELHTTLYNHMVDTARGTGLTRQGTPELGTAPLEADKSQKPDSRWIQPRTDDRISLDLLKGMSTRREMELWRNYLNEIALWLDMFDNERHFQNQLPLLAQTSPALKLSILALSARQLERKDPNKPYTESLGLYQEAIRLIASDLEGMTVAVIASCVLLCVLEMISSSPKDWSRHLDGCAMLLKASGINGVVGGMKQAIFWCFARMDMWGGFLSESNTKIPTSLWFLPTGTMSTAISRFKSDFQNFDSYANYSVFLCASVLNVVSNQGGSGTPAEKTGFYSARWKALFDLLHDWHTNRPPEMCPLNLSSEATNQEGPFPTILYTNPAAMSGNQLYHTATLLMLQAKPKDVKLKGHKSIFWHARQICGISVSNDSHAAYTNALQPLWFAGKVMSSTSEHRVVLEVIDRIEKETGFATQWRAQDLKDHWGDEGD